MNFDDLLRDLVKPEADTARSRWSKVAGVVTAVNATTPPTATVSIGGADVPDLRYPKSVALTVGDTVWVAVKGTTAMFVEQALGSSGTAEGGGASTTTPGVYDNFRRADGALGTTSDGKATWTAVRGTWDIYAGRARVTSDVDNCLALIPAYADGFLSVNIGVNALGADCIAFRYTADGVSGWLYNIHVGALYRVTSTSTYTEVGNIGAGGSNERIEIAMQGSRIIVRRNNGTDQLTVTDTHNATQTHVGLRSGGASSLPTRWDSIGMLPQ